MAVRNALYLHGFASSPESTKGRLVRDALRDDGIPCVIPDLNLPTFSTLSPRRVLDTLTAYATESLDGTLIIGSSFGGYLALQLISRFDASMRARLAGLVLLAPVTDPWDSRSGLLTAERLQMWQAAGSLPVLHFGAGKELPLHFEFTEELRALGVPTCPPAELPTLVIHGMTDDVVPAAQSVSFFQKCSSVTCEFINDGHELLTEPAVVLELIRTFVRRIK